MGWVKTSECSLLNVSLAKEIKLYELTCGQTEVGYKMTAVFSDEERVLGYAKSLEETEEFCKEFVFRDLTTMHTSFRELCTEGFPEAQHQDGEDWDAYWERSEAFVQEKWKQVEQLELQVDVS